MFLYHNVVLFIFFSAYYFARARKNKNGFAHDQTDISSVCVSNVFVAQNTSVQENIGARKSDRLQNYGFFENLYLFSDAQRMCRMWVVCGSYVDRMCIVCEIVLSMYIQD